MSDPNGNYGNQNNVQGNQQQQQNYQPQQQNYQQPPMGYQPQKPQSNGKATAALVLGILSVVCLFLQVIPFVGIIGIVLGIVGLILGISAKKEAPSGMATAGIVLCIISIGINVIVLIACAACVGSLASLF